LLGRTSDESFTKIAGEPHMLSVMFISAEYRGKRKRMLRS